MIEMHREKFSLGAAAFELNVLTYALFTNALPGLAPPRLTFVSLASEPEQQRPLVVISGQDILAVDSEQHPPLVVRSGQDSIGVSACRHI